MGKDISFKNHDRFIHLGIAIAALRKMRGMSQEQLAEKAGISRSLISAIEAPGLAKSFSLDVFFNLADALDIDPADLINATVFPDRIFKPVINAASNNAINVFNSKPAWFCRAGFLCAKKHPICLRTFMRGLSASRRAACILPRGCTEAAGHDNSRGL